MLRRKLAVGIAPAIALLMLPTVAAADHIYDGIIPTATYGPACINGTVTDSPVCRTDNASVYWYADSNDYAALEQNDKDALSGMLSAQYQPTDLTVTHESNPVFSGSGETDIIYQEETDGLTGLYGITWCDDAVNGELYTCDQTYIRIVTPDGYRVEGGSVACHETGHAVGLVHGTEAYPVLDPGDDRLGCMENAEEFPPNLGNNSAHLINGVY
ncbi:hypothetical protein Mth01_26700 [Sphaerimonospora thailandensis]|uniref:Matrixin n=1 Tax=Sphaerimonospora thailandensis TaxID=795644 RepID=A0A8J3R7A1_9ACTN|nr:hypothetical protein Mth01_26700 [Sphaerimonospora thailandensis]